MALWQTHHVIEGLKANAPKLDVQVEQITTKGDRVRDRALSRVGGRGLFVKEIENALLAGKIDLAVHSLKDMPTELPDELALGAILERADPHAPYGLRGIGELPLISATPAVTAAVRAATGIELDRVPVRPAHLLPDLRGTARN